MEASSTAASRCFKFMYFLLPHWVPATWRSRAQTSMRAELPSGTSAAADLPVQPFNHIVGTDAGPVFAGELAVGQSLLNAILHLLGGIFQLYGTKFFHHSFSLFSGSSFALLSVECLEYLPRKGMRWL